MFGVDPLGGRTAVGEVAADGDSPVGMGPGEGRVGVDPVKSAVQHPDQHALAPVAKAVKEVESQLARLVPSHAVAFRTALVFLQGPRPCDGRQVQRPGRFVPGAGPRFDDAVQCRDAREHLGGAGRIHERGVEADHDAIEPFAAVQQLDGASSLRLSHGQHGGNPRRRHGQIQRVQGNAVARPAVEGALAEQLPPGLRVVQVHPTSHLVCKADPMVVGRNLRVGRQTGQSGQP